MTEKRYYYDDPLAAAWMARYFGMKFEHPTEKIGIHSKIGDWAVYYTKVHEVNDIDSSWIDVQWSKDKYYLHPDSVHLLEPQVGDIIIQEGDAPYIVISIEGYAEIGILYGKRYKFIEKECICDFRDADQFNWWIRENKIIQRNGLAFHFPKEEQACQK